MPGRRGGSSSRGWTRRTAAPRRAAAPVSSRRTTGLYTSRGTAVRNVQAYTKAGGNTYNGVGRPIQHGVAYATKVQQNSIRKAAATVVKQNPKAKAVSYIAQSSDGKRYVGYSTNPSQRMNAHISGHGAKATKQMNISRVTFIPHGSAAAAKKNETRLYYEQKAAHGTENVRGAGHTRGF